VNDFLKSNLPPPIEKVSNNKETPLPPPIGNISNTKKTIPPPKVKNPNSKNKPKSKKDLRIALHIVSAIVFFIIIIVVLNKNSRKSNTYPKSNYNTESTKSNYKSNSKKSNADLQNELGRREINNPLDYLSIKYKIDNKLFSGKTNINVKIYSSAKMATYKDVIVRIYYYTGTNTFISSEDYIIYK